MAKSKPICSIDQCGNHVVGWGLCEKHYRRWKRHGKTDDPVFVPRVCEVDCCNETASGPGTAHGYCKKHYARFYRHGDALGGGTPSGAGMKWLQGLADHEDSECLFYPFGSKGRRTVRFEGTDMNAARAMCILSHGQPPEPEMYACHKCRGAENGCVNPIHVYWGSPARNQMDRVRDGTSSRGEAAHAAKLTEGDVMEIRRLRGSVMRKDLAARYGVHPNTITRVVKGDRWGWLREVRK